MIETKVPKDIRAYKSKVVGPFTLRQVVCVVIAAIVDVVFFLCVFQPFHLPLNALVYVVMFLDLPIMAFCFEISGMPMEVYLKDVLLYSFLAPKNRKVKTDLPSNKDVKPDQSKEHEKKLQKRYQDHPDMKPID